MNGQSQEHTNLVNLTIDGIAISVPKGTTVYTAAQQLGINIPIFCYQDRMPPFGACRVCLVEVEKMPKPQPSCTLEATEGMVVKTQSPMAVQGRKGILEFLLINHPLDCPICDRGGECPLQEHALNQGPGESRFFEDKRHFKKPLPLGPVLMLDRERCIICARCTRFGELVSGDHALEFIERGYKTEVGTPDGQPVKSKYIGNTIMICPVGALTSQVYRFRARPWDNFPTESTCTLCPVGCSFILDSRDGEIMRTRSRENLNVNDIWLCDKGWFGYEFSVHPDRLKTPLIRRSGVLEPASWDEALNLIVSNIKESKQSNRLAAFGGNTLTVEENYLLQKLMREALGVNHVDHRIGMPLFALDEEGLEPGMEISLGDIEKQSFVLLLGIDLTEEFPVIWLRLKEAINRGAKVLFLGHFSPEIAPHLSNVILHSPGKELEMLQEHLPKVEEQIKTGKQAAIFIGRQYLSTSNRKSILAQLHQFKKATPNLSINILEGKGNSVGARFAGMRPDIGPFEKPLDKTGLNALQVLEAASHSGWDFLLVAGANPAIQFSSRLWNEAKAKTRFLVVQDLFLNETARQADVVLPTLCFVEKGGSFINIERRVQKLLPGKEIPKDIYSDEEIFVRIAEYLGFNLTLDTSLIEKLKPNVRIENSEFRSQNPNERIQNSEVRSQNQTKHNRSETTLSVTFASSLFDRGERMKHNPHIIQLSKEPKARINPQDGKRLGIQNGSRVRLQVNDRTISAKIKLDEGVSEGTLVLPLGFEQIPVHDLEMNLMNGEAVTVASSQ